MLLKESQEAGLAHEQRGVVKCFRRFPHVAGGLEQLCTNALRAPGELGHSWGSFCLASGLASSTPLCRLVVSPACLTLFPSGMRLLQPP